MEPAQMREAEPTQLSSLSSRPVEGGSSILGPSSKRPSQPQGGKATHALSPLDTQGDVNGYLRPGALPQGCLVLNTVLA